MVAVWIIVPNLFDDRTAVYRLFDTDGMLLYVGMTAYPTIRFSSHRATKPWWHEVATRRLVWYATREAAAMAEIRAIQTEAPRYNVAIYDIDGRYDLVVPASGAHIHGDEAIDRQATRIIRTPVGRQPLYLQLADTIHQRIVAGEFPPGSSLPSEPDIRTEYELSLQTVRNAVDLLVLRGLVVKRHGARTRVRETVPMSLAQIPPGHRVRARPASDEERREYDLPPGAHMLVVVEVGTGLEIETYPADRYELDPGQT